MDSVKRYFEYLKSTFNFEHQGDVEVIDGAVYTRNRSFRLLYSSKFGKSNALKIPGRPPGYSPRDVARSLIQVMAPPHYRGPLRWARGEVHTFCEGTPPGGKRKRGEGGVGVGAYIPPTQVPEGVQYYIKERGGILRGGRLSGNFMSYIVSGLKCPWIGDKHKNNNTYFTINMQTGNSWLRCADEDCKPMHYCKLNLKWAFDS
jgi:hypothetical protein